MKDTPEGWRRFIDDIRPMLNVDDNASVIRNEFLKYNATYICIRDGAGFSSVEFADEKHYTMFVLQFGTLETQLDDL
jgi:hypothetical protein